MRGSGFRTPAGTPARRAGRLLAVAAAAMLAACAVGPDYERPPVATPVSYKEAEGWKLATPQDHLDRGAWWAMYGDPVLHDLLGQITVSNQNLKAAEAAYRQASALVRAARASHFPLVTADGSVQRSHVGGGSGGNSSSGTSGRSFGGRTITDYDTSLGASWVPDLWGRIRRTVESNVASAQASAADLASARLSAETALATAYIQLRINDEQKRLLDASVEAFTASLEIARNRYDAGVAAQSDVVSAQAQLELTRAQAVGIGVLRAQLEHAIAVLVGKAPAEVSLPSAPFSLALPVIPPGLPSALLERRPDISSAERQMAATNAQIGVAMAAFYPDLTLSASVGYTSTALGNLLQASNQLWSLGAQIVATLFDAGERSARVDAARAVYDQAVAGYRQTVLTAFQQVEDQLAALRILARQSEVQDGAVAASREAEQLVLNQYRAGTVPYTSVLTAQTTRLGNEQGSLNILQSQLVASVNLIVALGGDWNAADMPGREALSRNVFFGSGEAPALAGGRTR